MKIVIGWCLVGLLAVSVPIPAESGEHVGVVEAGEQCSAGEVVSLDGRDDQGWPVWGCVPSRLTR